MERGLLIRPDSERIRVFLPSTALQLGFLMLSSGGDPASMVRKAAVQLESRKDCACTASNCDGTGLSLAAAIAAATARLQAPALAMNAKALSEKRRGALSCIFLYFPTRFRLFA